MNRPSSLAFRIAVLVWCLAVAAAAVMLLVVMAQMVISTPIPFDIDETNHAIDSWEVYHAIATRSPGDLYRAVVGQAFYPPVFSLFVAAYYLVFGPGLVASRMPGVVNYALLIFGFTWLVFYLVRRSSSPPPATSLALVGAGFAGAMAVTSPTLIRNAVLCMLEITSALLLVPLLYLAERLDSSTGRARWIFLILAALTVMLAFLTKYTFGLFLAPALAAALVSRTLPWKAGRQAWREALAVVGIYISVLLLWLLVTNRQSMFLFFTDHPSYMPFWLLENFLYYPRIYLNEYSPNPFISIFALVLAAVQVGIEWRRLYVRLAAWAFLAALVILTISTTKEPRHMLIIAPLIWVLAGVRLAGIFAALMALPRRSLNAALALGLLLVLFVTASLPAVESIRPEIVKSFEGKPYYSALEALAVRLVDLDQPVLVIGDTDDKVNLLALRWQAALESGRSMAELDIDQYPFDIYDRILYRHNRRPQANRLLPDFPAQSLGDVLAQGHYAAVIALRNREKKISSLGEGVLPELESYPAETHRLQDWELTIYPLR
jgi:4-amino-4-deoxy-L-arabinose transferase-like glycosyltransferase